MRGLAVRLHRYAGLTLALFLMLAGLTGSVIAFEHELDAWLNPQLFEIPVRGHARALAPDEIAARVDAADPQVRAITVPLRFEDGQSEHLHVEPRIDPATGEPFAIGYDQVFIDPATADILGRREWGSCCFEREHLIPFLYRVHYSLALPDQWGLWLMGCLAIVWVIDCFIGVYLTLPRRNGKDLRAWLAKWKTAWKIKTGAGAARLNYDVHRAGALWLWILLLMMAFSAFALNLRYELFRPLVAAMADVTPSPFERAEERLKILASRTDRAGQPRLSYNEIVPVAEREARTRGWTEPAEEVFHATEYGAYGVSFGRYENPGFGAAWLYFDDVTGEPLGAEPGSHGTLGDAFIQIQYPLHSGRIIGLPGRIAISLLGLAVATLSITGVVIWWKKRLTQPLTPALSPKWRGGRRLERKLAGDVLDERAIAEQRVDLARHL